eukprot:CAMPEP_0171158246 /NCGR_PEP_ID=MMETSP0790-20130122/2397_1 /TAXON_ID=2925 /ORGANISM="Alexandrium catenella, Strain OF101" /LENGTH=239 /DNA_ID=CAMNT_0011622651 /DNA_START=62 /DNA_END=779 /DNA_ORIENTATION=-
MHASAQALPLRMRLMGGGGSREVCVGGEALRLEIEPLARLRRAWLALRSSEGLGRAAGRVEAWALAAIRKVLRASIGLTRVFQPEVGVEDVRVHGFARRYEAGARATLVAPAMAREVRVGGAVAAGVDDHSGAKAREGLRHCSHQVQGIVVLVHARVPLIQVAARVFAARVVHVAGVQAPIKSGAHHPQGQVVRHVRREASELGDDAELPHDLHVVDGHLFPPAQPAAVAGVDVYGGVA